MKFGVTGTITSTLAAALLASTTTGMASSHREAPAITKTPKIDNTDVYAFRSYEPGRKGFVTLIANYQPLQDPFGGPNYFTMDPDAFYEIHVDSDGDAVEDLTFQFEFNNELKGDDGITLEIGDKDIPIALRQIGQITEPSDPQQNEREFYSLTLVTGDRRSGTRAQISNRKGGGTTFEKPIDNIGEKTIPNYEAYEDKFLYDIEIPGCRAGRMFVGQREEAFAVNLGEIFDLVNFVPIEADSFPGGIRQDRRFDDLVDQLNVTTLALEIPIDCLTGNGNGVIGVWATSSLAQAQLEDPTPTYEQDALYGGSCVQQSRLGNPLVNEVVIGLTDKNLFNAAEPMDDAQFLDYVTNPTFPEILNSLFLDAVNQTLGTDLPTLAPTNIPRDDLVATFLTGIDGLNQQATVTPSEMMRLNTAVAPTPRGQQENLGVIAGDIAGYPNGRRPGDDAVDITLRVAMGRLCHPIAGVAPDGLGLCEPDDAPTGLVPYTDGAPIDARELQDAFPYLNTPLPGSTNGPFADDLDN